MPQPWEAEHPVGRELAVELVREQFPEVADLEPVRVGEGWDCDVWRFGEVAFRFPRREFGVRALQREARVLPALAPRLSLPIPAPIYFGQPSPRFPALFVGHPYLAGVTGDAAGLSDAERHRVAPRLGTFVRELHSFDLGAAADVGAPVDGFRGDMQRRARFSLALLPELAETPWVEHVPEIRSRLEQPPASAPQRRTLTHGDLYARHILFDEQREPCGIIDWGDVAICDPAVDLALVGTLLPPAAREGFWAAYGAVDDATWERARYLSLTYAAALLAYGSQRGDRPLLAEFDRALHYCLES